MEDVKKALNLLTLHIFSGKRMTVMIITIIVTWVVFFTYILNTLGINLWISIIAAIILWFLANLLLLFLFLFYSKYIPQEKVKTFVKHVASITGTRQDILITQQTFENNQENSLPLCLKQLQISNYQQIENLEIGYIPSSNWIFLIGENGFGKTTILKGIAIGFIGDKDGKDILIDDFDARIGIEYYENNISKIKNLWNNINSKSVDKIICYGHFRLQLLKDSSENDEKNSRSISYGLFNDLNVYLNIEYELKKYYWKENFEKFETIKNILCLLTGFVDIEIGKNDEVLYYEKDDNDNILNGTTFNQLASGFRSIIAMVGDMMIRLFKSQPDISEPSKLAGIVIIDELDLHWHPKMQREIPKLLSSIFPKVQFIASTHSLVPLLGAPENSVLLKVNRTKEAGITAERVDIDFQALSTDTMLRDIFDLEKYMSDAKISAWERFKELTRLIKAEQVLDIKESLMDERREIGNKYSFPI